MKITNKTVLEYLKLTENSESPWLHHLWSLLFTASCCLGRRNYFELGDLTIYPNMYVLLSGNPGVRKSTAINTAKSLIEFNTRIRFAPDDTGGQRQGLIAAMVDEELMTQGEETDAVFKELEKDLPWYIEKEQENKEQRDKDIIEAIGNMDTTMPYLADSKTLYVFASEFSTFIGIKNFELITYLTKMWDGENYEYRLKSAQCKIKDPLLGIIGGTTPTAIANALPLEAVGQGFLSRVILVYGDKNKSIPRPRKMNPLAVKEVRDCLYRISNEFIGGAFKEDPDAAALLDSLYDKEHTIDDGRFEYYNTRRHTHLIKVIMALAALRGSHVISVDDVNDAETIMIATEQVMPDALGEFGLSSLSVVRQKILDYIKSCRSVVGYTAIEVRSHVSRDVKPQDFMTIMRDLIQDGSIVAYECKDNVVRYTVPKKKLAKDKIEELFKL